MRCPCHEETATYTPVLTPRIIADLRAGEECADPDHPGLRVRRTNAARERHLHRHRYDGEVRTWLQNWAEQMNALTTPNLVSISAAKPRDARRKDRDSQLPCGSVTYTIRSDGVRARAVQDRCRQRAVHGLARRFGGPAGPWACSGMARGRRRENFGDVSSCATAY